MKPMFENSSKRMPKLLLSISSIAVLLILLGIGAFTLIAPHQAAHADPPPQGGRCLSGSLTNDGPINGDAAHQAKVTAHVFNTCLKGVNGMTASITVSNNCPGLGGGSQTIDRSLGSAGTMEYRNGSIGVSGNCVVCHYTNGIHTGTDYPAFTMTVMLDDITATDTSGSSVGLGENGGLLTIQFANGGPGPDAPTCPPAQ